MLAYLEPDTRYFRGNHALDGQELLSSRDMLIVIGPDLRALMSR